jgi:hypothetical protein
MTWIRSVRLLTAAFVLGLLIGAGQTADAAKKVEFFYILDDSDVEGQRVHGFSIGSGLLSALPGSPFLTGNTATGCGGYCQTISYSEKKKLLFVGSFDGVVVFSVAADGSLTEVPGSPFGGVPVTGVEAVTKGKKTFVYACNFYGDKLLGFKVGKGGSLTPVAGFPRTVADGPSGIAYAGSRLFLANQSASSISVFTVRGNGSVTEVAGSPAAAAGFLYNVSPDAGGGFFYVHNTSGDVSGFSTAAGLPQLPGSPFAFGLDQALIMGPGVLGAGLKLNGVQPLARDAAGVLSPSTGFQDFGLSFANSGAYNSAGQVFGLADSGSDTARLYTVGPGTGFLTPLDTEPAALTLNQATDATFARR